MFRFAMNLTDAIDHGCFAGRYGIEEDTDFSRLRAEGLQRKHPGFVPHLNKEWTEADVEYNRLENELVFRWENQTPRSVGEAIALVREAFFYPPVRVWLGEEEFILADTRQDDLVARHS